MKCYVKVKLDENQEPYWVCTRFGVCRRPMTETKCYYENCGGRQEITSNQIPGTKAANESTADRSDKKVATPIIRLSDSNQIANAQHIASTSPSISREQEAISESGICSTEGCENAIKPPHKLYCSRRCQRIHNKRKSRQRKKIA